MEFYRKRIVKKPRKKYNCYLCGEPILGKHVYVSQKLNMDFSATREHIQCNEYAVDMCNHCDGDGLCSGSLSECFKESKREEGERHANEEKKTQNT